MAQVAPFVECESQTFVAVPYEVPPDRVAFDTITDASPQDEIIETPSPLSAALGGIARGRVVLLFGPMGAGKSTLSAQTAALMADQTQGTIFWCDRDQNNDPSLVRRCFDRTGAPTHRVRLARLGKDLAPTWQSLFKHLPRSRADIIVLDTLQGWTKPEDLDAFSHACQSHPATFFIIARVNKAGEVEGLNSIQHDVDAIAHISRDEIRVNQKCRWTPTPRKLNRLDGTLTLSE